MIKSWQNALIPKNKSFFAIGDIHGEFKLLEKLLKDIESKIESLSKYIDIVFIGDYIDRGLNSKKTIDILINFQNKYQTNNYIKVYFLCGNHDDFFIKFFSSSTLIKDPQKSSKFYKKAKQNLLMTKFDEIYISGLKIWFDIGGGKTTIRNYSKSLCLKLEKLIATKNLTEAYIEKINHIVNEIKILIPETHKRFFLNLRNNSHLIIGEFLFTHAGIDPNKSLCNQGIGLKKKKLNQEEFLDLIMLRDKFLWRDDLPNCPYYVIHGHTPSAIRVKKTFIADGQKKYRLCIDSKVYDQYGSLTYFFKSFDEYYLSSFPKKSTQKVLRYK